MGKPFGMLRRGKPYIFSMVEKCGEAVNKETKTSGVMGSQFIDYLLNV